MTPIGSSPHPAAIVRAGIMLLVSIAAALAIAARWTTSFSFLQDIARACAVLTLVWTLAAVAAPRRRAVDVPQVPYRWRFRELAFVVALLLGVVVAVIQSMVLVMRGIYVALDLINDFPYLGEPWYGFTADGIWSLAFIAAACVISLASLRERHLVVGSLWALVLLSVWACLLPPVLRSMPPGGYERTGSTLLLLLPLSVLPAMTVSFCMSYLRRRQTKNLTRNAAQRAEQRPSRDADERTHTGVKPPMYTALRQDLPGDSLIPGLTSSVAILAGAVTLLVCYHLVVPVGIGRGGHRATALLVAAGAAVSGASCSLLLRLTWNRALADAAMGLISLALCALATLAVPADTADLAERYPMLFNAMLVGFAASSVLWTKRTVRWRKLALRTGGGETSARLVPHGRRAAFVSAAMALVLGAAMALWPRLPGIAAMDDSLGRFTAGVGANLFLLLIMLWSSRRLRSPAFHILTVLIVLSASGFVLARMLPFTPRFG